jgi:hypothetical protein
LGGHSDVDGVQTYLALACRCREWATGLWWVLRARFFEVEDNASVRGGEAEGPGVWAGAVWLVPPAQLFSSTDRFW